VKDYTPEQLAEMIDRSLKQTADDVREGRVPLDGRAGLPRAKVAAISTDEFAAKIVRSLRENSAELAREQRSQKFARARQLGLMCIIFVAGVAAGALLITAL
jgi:hypothetical protein